MPPQRKPSRLLRRAALALAFAALTLPARPCGPFFPEALFVRPDRPDDPYTRFLQGRLGVPQPGYRVRHLVLAYRALNGLPLTPAQQAAALAADAHLTSADYSDAPLPGLSAWLHARIAFGPVDGSPGTGSGVQFGAPGGQTSPTIPTDRSVPGSDSYNTFPNCLDDSFQTAAQTLAARQAAHGEHSPDVVEWVRGQDQVFRNCGDTPASSQAGSYHPPTTPPASIPAQLPHAPVWLQQDRSYQRAAASFYAADYPAARTAFAAIAADANSPWSPLSAYLGARVLIRQASLQQSAAVYGGAVRGPGFQQVHATALAQLREAQALLQSLLAEPRMRPLAPAIDRLLSYVALRIDPRAQALVLTARLSAPTTGEPFRQDLIDLSFLASYTPPGDPHGPVPLSLSSPGSAPPSLSTSGADLWTWLTTFAGTGAPSTDATPADRAAALARIPTLREAALAQWRSTGSRAWLFAALATSTPGAPGNDALLAAARLVPADAPGAQAITYHRLRLSLADPQTPAQLAQLRPTLDHTESRSTLNLFAALSSATATTLEQWLATAGSPAAASASDDSEFSAPLSSPATQPADKPEDQPCGPALLPAHVPLFTPPAAEALNTRMPLSVLATAAESHTLPPNLRFLLAQATWARAVLLAQPAIAHRMTPILTGCRPAWAPVLATYNSATTPGDQHRAGLLALMRFSSTEPVVRPGFGREEGFATYSDFRDNWWSHTVAGAPSAATDYTDSYATWHPAPATGTAVAVAAVPDDEPQPTPLVASTLPFLTPQERTAAANELATLRRIPAASDYFAIQALSWWHAHPQDPTNPDLLGEAMRVARNAASTPNTSALQHQLFNALHTAYPNSEWSKRYTTWQ